MNIFLSGGTRGEWQDEVARHVPEATFFDPRTLTRLPMRTIAETEREWLDHTDLVFFYFEESNPSGLGSAFEVGYAVAKGVPVIFVDEKNTSHTEWLGIHCQYVCTTLDEGLRILKKLAGDESSSAD